MSPIKPENQARYPKNWKEIRASILNRADNRCEECRIKNHDWGYRFPDGKFVKCSKKTLGSGQIIRPPFGIMVRDRLGERVVRVIEVILTIAHLDHAPENCDPANLKAMCQRCHLRYDRHHHAKNAAITRAKKAAAG